MFLLNLKIQYDRILLFTISKIYKYLGTIPYLPKDASPQIIKYKKNYKLQKADYFLPGESPPGCPGCRPHWGKISPAKNIGTVP